MRNRRRRRISIAVLAIVAVGVGAITWIVVGHARGETVRSFSAVATWRTDGTASAHETIDYFFPSARHGIYRVLPDNPWGGTDDVAVTADHTRVHAVEPDIQTLQEQMVARGIARMTVDPDEMTGLRVRIGDPARTVSGDHRYRIDYPLYGTAVDGGATVDAHRIGWDGVGTSWDVPIDRVQLDLVAPWRWEGVTCDAGRSGSIGSCTVTQPVPGRLEISHGRVSPGEGITVYATRGAALAAAPAARPAAAPRAAPWWMDARLVGLVAAAVFILIGSAVARLLRLAGRDVVMAGPASTDSAVDLAFVTSGATAPGMGTRRVDDTRLARWAGTEFAPPRGIAAWQGGILVAETVRDEHRVAWLAQAAADGYVEWREAGPGSVTMISRDHPPDETTTLLGVAFRGRDRLRLGAYDPGFASLWATLGNHQRRWLATSPFIDHRAERRVAVTRVIGAVSFVAMSVIGFAASVAVPAIAAAGAPIRFGAAVPLGLLVVAAIAGAALAASLRAWELHVRTPAGSAMWLRVESFRRFLAGSEAEHVRQAAERGVLRDYAAWAVALGEADHWNAMVTAAGLPPATPGLSASAMSSSLHRACVSSSTSPSSSGGSGGSSFSSSSSSGVGGGGGGGGGGSW